MAVLLGAVKGRKMYVSTNGASNKLVSNKKDASKFFYIQAAYLLKFYKDAKLKKINSKLPSKVGMNYIVEVTK